MTGIFLSIIGILLMLFGKSFLECFAGIICLGLGLAHIVLILQAKGLLPSS